MFYRIFQIIYSWLNNFPVCKNIVSRNKMCSSEIVLELAIKIYSKDFVLKTFTSKVSSFSWKIRTSSEDRFPVYVCTPGML
jgi:hypothetical protein